MCPGGMLAWYSLHLSLQSGFLVKRLRETLAGRGSYNASLGFPFLIILLVPVDGHHSEWRVVGAAAEYRISEPSSLARSLTYAHLQGWPQRRSPELRDSRIEEDSNSRDGLLVPALCSARSTPRSSHSVHPTPSARPIPRSAQVHVPLSPFLSLEYICIEGRREGGTDGQPQI